MLVNFSARNLQNTGLIKVLFFAEPEETQICYENHPMSVELEKGQDLKFELWKSNIKALSEDFKCHLWCNERGDLPTAIPVSNVKSELMESLVNELVNFFPFFLIKNFL